MPVEIDLRMYVDVPDETRDAREILAAALAEAVQEAADNLRANAPMDTGQTQAGFTAMPEGDGGRLRNDVRYAGYVREFAGAPPLGVLAWVGIRDLAVQKLEEAGDDVAAAMAREIMQPLIQEARRRGV